MHFTDTIYLQRQTPFLTVRTESVPWTREGTNAVFSMKDVRSGDDGEIGRSDGTSAASEVISEVSAASEHSAAVTIRRSGTVAETGCISHPPTLHGQEVSGLVCDYRLLLTLLLRFDLLAIVWCDGDRPGKSVPWTREGTNAVFSMKDVRSGDDGEISVRSTTRR